MPVAARIAGGSSKPARASTREIGKGLHSPSKNPYCCLPAEKNRSQDPMLQTTSKCRHLQKGCGERCLRVNRLPLPERTKEHHPSLHRAQIGTGARFDAEKQWNTNGIPKRSCCELLRLVLDLQSWICSRSNLRYSVHGHHTSWAMRREQNTVH